MSPTVSQPRGGPGRLSSPRCLGGRWRAPRGKPGRAPLPTRRPRFPLVPRVPGPAGAWEEESGWRGRPHRLGGRGGPQAEGLALGGTRGGGAVPALLTPLLFSSSTGGVTGSPTPPAA